MGKYVKFAVEIGEAGETLAEDTLNTFWLLRSKLVTPCVIITHDQEQCKKRQLDVHNAKVNAQVPPMSTHGQKQIHDHAQTRAINVGKARQASLWSRKDKTNQSKHDLPSTSQYWLVGVTTAL